MIYDIISSMQDEKEQKMRTIVERLERGEEVSPEDLQSLKLWYTESVKRLKDDIEITKIKKDLDI